VTAIAAKAVVGITPDIAVMIIRSGFVVGMAIETVEDSIIT
jgi:hypothetical protein